MHRLSQTIHSLPRILLVKYLGSKSVPGMAYIQWVKVPNQGGKPEG